ICEFMQIWEPKLKENTNMYNFILFVNKRRGKDFKNYWELYEWSINEPEYFWEDVWDFVGIIYSRKYEKILEDPKKFPGTKWFIGAKLNFAQNLMKFRDDKKAIIFRGEPGSGKYEEISYNLLYRKVYSLYHYLSEIGFSSNDRAVAYMPNIPETVISMLSVTSLGATWSSAGTELGPRVLLDRFGQVSPKVLFTVDGYYYKGKKYSTLETIRVLLENIKTLESVIIFPYIEKEERLRDKRIIYGDEIENRAYGEIKFEQVDFNHPLYIMFSSGTTGKPKSMVQSVGGVLINHLKELIIHSDLKINDIISYITSPSWMMWNWLVSSLAVGSTIFLYDGNPLYPDWKTMWKFVEMDKISIFGCSASYIYSLKSMNASPINMYDLTSLREISQTGSPLSKEGFRWVYENIKKDLHLNSISGGTDINGCFAIGSPLLPVNEGEIQSPGLGMKIKCYDENGKEIYDSVGELVCELPSPSMPLYFLDDKNNERYIETYFSFYKPKGKNVWRHGDFVIFHSDTKGITILGRSDSTLKPSGVRIGTAEIYSVIETIPQIVDSVVVGKDVGGDQEIILFVKMKEGEKLNDELRNKIRELLRKNCSPRHVPDKIIEVKDIPYTFNQKKVEIAVSNIVNGKPIINKDTIVNPESLQYIEEAYNSFGKS
ncbi:MAG: acetoacetate--CoA ligase, partial [Thermoplasmata archaeon]